MSIFGSRKIHIIPSLLLTATSLLVSCSTIQYSQTFAPTASINLPGTATPLPAIKYLPSPEPPARVDINPEPWLHSIKASDLGSLSVLLSPNDEWVISHYYLETKTAQTLDVISTSDPKKVLGIPLEKNLGLVRLTVPNGIVDDLEISSWSPDSTAFAATGSNGGYPKSCNFVAIIALDSNGSFRQSTYDWQQDTNCPGITWSPDGSEIALKLDDSLRIINRDGQLIHQMDWMVNKGDLVWTQTGIFVFSANTLAREDPATQLYLIDPTTMTKRLIYSYDQYSDSSPTIVGWAMDSHFMLFYDRTHAKLFLFDSQSHQITQRLPLANLGAASHQYPSPYAGLVITNTADDSTHLVVFDWSSQTLRDYGQVRQLIGWYPPLNGFLVVMPDNQYVVLIPQP